MIVRNKYANYIPEPSAIIIFLAIIFMLGAYLVLLLSAAIPTGIGAGLIYGIVYVYTKLDFGIPKGLLISLGALFGVYAFLSIYAVLKGIIQSFNIKPHFEPAIYIDLKQEHAARSFISALCKTMNTKEPDVLLLHSKGDFFVKQGRIKVLDGRVAGRILSIGTPLLSFLSVNELRAILSHEFAHFTGRDTLYSSIVLPIYVSLTTALEEMSDIIKNLQTSNNSFYTSVSLMIPIIALNLYLKTFHTLNMKISRLREKRADIIATEICGFDSFSRGIIKTINISQFFENFINDKFGKSPEQDLQNLDYYSEFRSIFWLTPDLSEGYLSATYDYPEDKDAPHPATLRRLSYIPMKEEQYKDNRVSRSLFVNHNAYEKALTNYYKQRLSFYKSYSLHPAQTPSHNIICQKCGCENWAGSLNCLKCNTTLRI